MASTGFVAELSKKPPLVRLGLLLLVLLLLAGVYYQLLYSGLKKDIKAQEDSASALLADQQKVIKEEKEYEELKAKQDVLEAMIKENDSALPTAAQLPAFFDMLSRKVGESSVEVKRWDPQKEVAVEETVFKVPVEIQVQGTFYELKKFFYLLYKMNQKEDEDTAAPGDDTVEDRDRILTIEDLRIGDPEVKNNELLLTATFRASTFRKEVPAAPPPDDKAKKPAEPAKTDGKQPAPSGLTGAPARAKEKTEDALEKSEQRIEKAPGTQEATGADRVKGGM